MKAVFVNHCHPEVPHVCAVRLREFASALATRGHQIILLTETLQGHPGPSPAEVTSTLQQHDWSTPFRLTVAPAGWDSLRAARNGKLPRIIGRTILAAHYLFYGGVHTDWRQGTNRYLEILANQFAPDIVWATFGNTSGWQIARDIARQCNCPWIADLKDHWESFIPGLLRNRLAMRFADAAAMTAFSDEHAATVSRWFHRPAEVVYSGIDPALYPSETTLRPTVTLTGAIYEKDALTRLIDGLVLAASQIDPDVRKTVTFRYAGHDSAIVRDATNALARLIAVDVSDQVPLQDWLEVLSGATLNCYVKSHRTFHHKVFDLLGASRPVLTIPRETDEAREIARSAGGLLLAAETKEDVAKAVQQALDAATDRTVTNLDSLSWQHRSNDLERVLQSVIGGR